MPAPRNSRPSWLLHLPDCMINALLSSYVNLVLLAFFNPLYRNYSIGGDAFRAISVTNVVLIWIMFAASIPVRQNQTIAQSQSRKHRLFALLMAIGSWCLPILNLAYLIASIHRCRVESHPSSSDDMQYCEVLGVWAPTPGLFEPISIWVVFSIWFLLAVPSAFRWTGLYLYLGKGPKAVIEDC